MVFFWIILKIRLTKWYGSGMVMANIERMFCRQYFVMVMLRIFAWLMKEGLYDVTTDVFVKVGIGVNL